MDAIVDLARFCAKTRYEEIPADVVARAKRLVLDTIGAALAGTRGDGCRELAGLAVEWGGAGEATVIGAGRRVPVPNAAMVNGTMMRALELDECHIPAILHAFATVLPVALGLAERQGSVSGRDLLTAVITAVDLTTRMSLAPRISSVISGMSFTYQMGTFGAAAAGGRILGFDEDRMVNALGLAYSQVSGNQQCLIDGTLTIRVQQGLSSKAGALAAILAERGITGPKEVLQGKFGYYPVYHRNDYDPTVLTRDLGRHYEIVNNTIKPYPCCRFTHPGIAATLALVREHDLRPEEVADVAVQVNNVTHFTMVAQAVGENGYGRPPRTVVEAQWSLPYAMATAIVRRRVFLEAFTEEGMRDPEVLELTGRIRPTIDPNVDRETGRGDAPPSIVEVTTRDGRRLVKRLDYAPGSPQSPLSDDELREKFRNCAAWALRPLPTAKLDAIIETVDRLEELDDVADLAGMLA